MKSPLRQFDNLRPFLLGRLPGQLIIQYSNHCNANCPQCGMRRSDNIPRHTLQKDNVKKMIDSAAEKGFKALSFTGGEPLMFFEDIIELIDHAGNAGIPFIRTGTNGFVFKDSDSADYTGKITRLVEKLAATNIYTFWISLDSAIAEDHEEMRGLKGVVKGIEKALPIFHEHGIYPAVNLGINRATGGKANQVFLKNQDITSQQAGEFLKSFQTSFRRFYQFVSDLGFTTVNACYPMSDESNEDKQGAPTLNSLYGAMSSDNIISFTPAEKTLIFKALFQTIPKFRGKLRIFSPRCSLYSLVKKFAEQQQPLFPCRGGSDFFFVDCEKGLAYPCGYRNDEKLAELPDLHQRHNDVGNCDLCEWECFRDPSDLMGPFAEVFSRPHKLFKNLFKDPKFFSILLQDLRYYKACDYFSGRVAPRFGALRKFER